MTPNIAIIAKGKLGVARPPKTPQFLDIEQIKRGRGNDRAEHGDRQVFHCIGKRHEHEGQHAAATSPASWVPAADRVVNCGS